MPVDLAAGELLEGPLQHRQRRREEELRRLDVAEQARRAHDMPDQQGDDHHHDLQEEQLEPFHGVSPATSSRPSPIA
ncbi:hypothetical protein D3C87_1877000 [compost metagenome]